MISENKFIQKFNILQNKFKGGLFEEVINDAKSLLRKKKHQVLFNIICLSYQNLGKFNDAIDIMEEGLSINSRNVHFLNNIGVSYYKLNNFRKAKYYFVKGLEIEPEYITILNNLGNLNRDLNNTQEAIKNYEKCLSLNSKLEQPSFNLALCYESVGKFDQAIKILQGILLNKPEFTECDRIISSMTKYKKNHEHYLDMKKKLSNSNLNDNQKMHLNFSLGKYYEDTKDFDNSFENYF